MEETRRLAPWFAVAVLVERAEADTYRLSLSSSWRVVLARGELMALFLLTERVVQALAA